MIVLQEINKVYGKQSVLNNISITIPNGQFVAITGESGSGKSTLLSIMSGINQPTSGQVYIEENNLSKLNDIQMSHLRNTKIGFVFQNYFLTPEYTVLQNVKLPLLLRKKEKNIDKQCDIILNKVGLIDKRDMLVKNLSGGEQQRCAIARALVTSPEVIFADEPCGNLDTSNGKIIMSIFKQMKDDGKTVVLVTHNLSDAKKADRIITLKDGYLIKDEELV